MKIKQLDHFVLTVADLERTVQFYTEVLGMELISFGAGRKALRFGEQKINLHPKTNTFAPLADHPQCGAMDFCLIAETPVETMQQELIARNVSIVEGIVSRTGAKGEIRSLYIKDPDGNLVELSNYVREAAPDS